MENKLSYFKHISVHQYNTSVTFLIFALFDYKISVSSTKLSYVNKSFDQANAIKGKNEKAVMGILGATLFELETDMSFKINTVV